MCCASQSVLQALTHEYKKYRMHLLQRSLRSIIKFLCLLSICHYCLIVSFENENKSHLIREISKKDIEIVRFLDVGRYSFVFSGYMRTANGRRKKIVIKTLRPVCSYRIQREIDVLLELSESPEIIRIEGICNDPLGLSTSLIFEHLGENTTWLHNDALKTDLNPLQVKLYLFKLLKAIRACHSKGIMHRYSIHESSQWIIT